MIISAENAQERKRNKRKVTIIETAVIIFLGIYLVFNNVPDILRDRRVISAKTYTDFILLPITLVRLLRFFVDIYMYVLFLVVLLYFLKKKAESRTQKRSMKENLIIVAIFVAFLLSVLHSLFLLYEASLRYIKF